MDSPLAAGARPEKALWYQEVLSLDPDSRIFLPYARLLVELGRSTEAMDILRTGLSRHPEFLEARLLLIELLHDAGQDASAGFEAEGIIDLLSQSSALWRIWSRKPGLRADLSAMLLFFASSMGMNGHSLSEVFEAGVAALEEARKTKAEALTSQKTEAAASVEPVSVPDLETSAPSPAAEAPAQAFVMPEDAPWQALDAVPDDDIYDDDDGPAIPALLFAQTAQNSLPEQTEVEHIPAMVTVPRGTLEGKSSLCTRSMAHVLEEQGATDEAADIYRELLESCASQEERDELSAKLASLLQGGDNPAAAQHSTSCILDMLESLADRLENRNRA